MRPTLLLLLVSGWAAIAVAQAQTAVATQPSRSTKTRPPAAAPSTSRRRSAGRRVRSAIEVTKRPAPADAGGGVLALGASDITGNKELPKVMAIVPWKSPTDAVGVVAPDDSVMNEVLGPVDRGVFQRRIRYYGQLDAAGERPSARPVAPVGDTR